MPRTRGGQAQSRRIERRSSTSHRHPRAPIPHPVDAKFYYYFIRPYELDNSIQTRLGKIPHPSYPSARSCITSAYANVLASLFPSERSRFAAMIEDAGMSRIYAGLHYRFDLAAGQELGRQVASYVLENGANRRSAIPLD